MQAALVIIADILRIIKKTFNTNIISYNNWKVPSHAVENRKLIITRLLIDKDIRVSNNF